MNTDKTSLEAEIQPSCLGAVMRCSFTLVVKRYKRENCTLDDMRSIYSGNTCLIAKNSKFGGLYIHKSGKIIKGKFVKVAGSVRYPILIAQDEVHIRFENFHSMPNIITDQYVKQDIISVVDLSCAYYMLGANENEQQLFIEQRQNEMLIKECEDLKKENELQQEHLMHNEAELIPLREKFHRLQDNILVYQKQSEADWFQICERDKKIEELKEAVNWALNHCKPERDELHSDFFNILTNAANCPIDEEIKHVRNRTGYN